MSTAWTPPVPVSGEWSDHEHYFGLSLAIGIALVAAFAPMLAFYVGLLVLIVASRALGRRSVRWLGLICAFSISVSMASRHTFGLDDDFTNYYKVYLNVMTIGWPAVRAYGNEMGLPLFYGLVGATGLRSPILPLFAVSMLSSGLLVMWLDEYGSESFPPERYGTVMAITLLFCGMLMSTQVTRQFISCCFLLFAISGTGWRRLPWLVAATLFHQSAIPLFLMILLVEQYRWRFVIWLFGGSLLLLLYFQAIVRLGLTMNLSVFALGYKFLYYSRYYTETAPQSPTAATAQLRLLALIVFAALSSSKYMPRGWPPLIVSVGILYLAFLPFPMMSFRLFLLFGVVITGYLIAFLAFRFGWVAMSWGAAALIFWRLAGEFSGRDTSTFSLWDKFDFAGAFPFYYFLSLFR